jgi:hypothetical protein
MPGKLMVKAPVFRTGNPIYSFRTACIRPWKPGLPTSLSSVAEGKEEKLGTRVLTPMVDKES